MNESLNLFINLARIITEKTRRFTGGLDGLGFSEFTILVHLNNAKNHQMRRIDLADKLGLTASGITRLLLPMEKIGLVTKEKEPRDARVSLVKLTDSGRRNLSESMERAEQMARAIFPSERLEKMNGLTDLIMDMGDRLE